MTFSTLNYAMFTLQITNHFEYCPSKVLHESIARLLTDAYLPISDRNNKM